VSSAGLSVTSTSSHSFNARELRFGSVWDSFSIFFGNLRLLDVRDLRLIDTKTTWPGGSPCGQEEPCKTAFMWGLSEDCLGKGLVQLEGILKGWVFKGNSPRIYCSLGQKGGVIM